MRLLWRFTILWNPKLSNPWHIVLNFWQTYGYINTHTHNQHYTISMEKNELSLQFVKQKLTMRCLAISSYDRHSKICSSIQSGKSSRLIVDVLFCITKTVIIVYNTVNVVFLVWSEMFLLIGSYTIKEKRNSSIACWCFYRYWQFDACSHNYKKKTMINKEEEVVAENGEETKDTCNQLHIAAANKFMTIHTNCSG